MIEFEVRRTMNASPELVGSAAVDAPDEAGDELAETLRGVYASGLDGLRDALEAS